MCLFYYIFFIIASFFIIFIQRNVCILREALMRALTCSFATLMPQIAAFFFSLLPFLLLCVQSQIWNQKLFCRAASLKHCAIKLLLFSNKEMGEKKIKCCLKSRLLLLLKSCLCVNCRGQQWVGAASCHNIPVFMLLLWLKHARCNTLSSILNLSLEVGGEKKYWQLVEL